MDDTKIKEEENRELIRLMISTVQSMLDERIKVAERLAKIEVLEIAKQMFIDLDEMNPVDYSDSFDVVNTLLEELKAGQP